MNKSIVNSQRAGVPLVDDNQNQPIAVAPMNFFANQREQASSWNGMTLAKRERIDPSVSLKAL